MKKLLLPLIILAVLTLGACTPKSCPTYAQTKWDTVPATHADLIAYMHQDTVPIKFTLLEKTGAIIVLLIAGNAAKD